MVHYFTAQNDSCSIKLSALFQEGSTNILKDTASLSFRQPYKYGQEGLEIPDGFWDNSKFVWRLIKSLNKKKKSEEVKELKKFCSENGLDFKSVKKDIKDIYKLAKPFNLFGENE